MKIAITGATGQVGGYLIKELAANHELLLFDLKPQGAATQGHAYRQGDLLKYEDCQKVVEGIDVVVHLAGIPYATDIPGTLERIEQRAAAMGWELPRQMRFDDTFRINVIGTWNLLTAMVEAGVGILVAASTNGVFGWDWIGSHPEAVKYLPLDEAHPIYPGGFSYDLSKAVNEQLYAAFHRRSGMKIYGIRPGWVWRPEALQKLAEGMGPATAWERNFFNYVDVRDLARAFRQCVEAAPVIESPLEMFCITAADTRAQEDSQVLIEKFQPGCADKAAHLVGRQSMISYQKAKQFFGYEPQHSWTDYL
jgi:nucleoside-diphosphate-sugar epimerase